MANLLRPSKVNGLAAAASVASDDAELLRRYRDSGDSEAFEGIVRRYGRTVLGVCQRILIERHDAEDAFQATFLQLVRKAHTLHSPVALAAWLYSTARRTALRHRRSLPPSTNIDPRGESQNPLDLLSARELLTAIEEEIARLPSIPMDQLQKLLADLGNEDFRTREAATMALKKLGDVAETEHRTFLRGDISAEQKQRILGVLDKRALVESDPERLRTLRSVEVLERVGTTGARSLLDELARGAAGSRLTSEALDAGRRLERRRR